MQGVWLRRAVSVKHRLHFLTSTSYIPIVDPEVRRKIEEDMRTAQQKMELAEEEKADVKITFSDVEKQKQTMEQREVWNTVLPDLKPPDLLHLQAELQSKKQAITDEAKRRISAQTRLGTTLFVTRVSTYWMSSRLQEEVVESVDGQTTLRLSTGEYESKIDCQ